MKTIVLPCKTLCMAMVVLSVLLISCQKEDPLDYKNPDLSIEERVDDLLPRMTLEEKFWQLFMIPGDLSDGKERYKHGIFGFQVATKGKSGNEAEQLLDYSGGGTAEQTAVLINEIQKYFVEETRLGIPIIAFDEALHGLVREGATAFPQSIALAATWDTLLVADVGKAITMETKTRGIRQILSPVLNIARDVRWGRTEETYGEDPFLTTQMGVSFISQFEKSGVLTTPKHFVANVGDGGRDSYPIHFNERLMEEIYFPAFKASFQKANAWSVMTSYNSFDGRQCTANDWLLNQKLKKEWGFDGFVISDAGATGGSNVLHFTAKDYAESTQQAIENGLDVIFQTSYDHYTLFYEAFEKGMINEAAIDEAVRRVLRAKFKLGLFENPYVDPQEASKWNGTKENRELAKKASLESMVLLKNDAQTLPLSKTVKSVAVIGTDAEEARLGGYSGPGNKPVSILEGLKTKLGENVAINHAAGPGRESTNYVTIPREQLYHYQDGEQKAGLQAEYFNNITLEGEPALTRIDPVIDFRWTLFSPDQEKINYDFYSARWTGKLKASETGTFKIGIKGNDGYRVYINGELVVDNWTKQTVRTITQDYRFEKGKEYDLKVEFFETVGNVWFKLLWDVGVENDWKQQIQQAVATAQKSDVAIVTVGIEEGEFRDRAYLSLPGHQEELIQSVAKTGKPMVVVLVGGSAITMDRWIDDVPSILDVWYPGDAGGDAIADVLFGDYNPAGRLPITFPVHEAQLPLYYNHKPTGRGDDYINLTGKPLFPFGYGLSYTTFAYEDIQIDAPSISKDQTTTVRFKVTNTGEFDGDEVVQLYLRDILASVARPIMELKGFQRVHLKKGETKELSFEITPEMLTMLNEGMDRVVEPGDFRIMIGSSSNDIRLRAILTVEP
ncbi:MULTISPECIES: glycoside hydrolase family 3 C-terminal domain-containing protein [Flavobacteriaceae]|uniref:glycoside hydrolase family 3 C-terminal domain-containing protein n=1 Tax=Flavobacteriaceae TaxID=49546 RepID=UPI00234B1A60|nr:glycoside hydrolase family 3 C-terminal domain-containing protein [Muricauda sp. SP22]MDC6361798.1 glycoside hydrolase family 3 C-terminal domain-containing protein [Muricauda sp. SP22]